MTTTRTTSEFREKFEGECDRDCGIEECVEKRHEWFSERGISAVEYEQEYKEEWICNRYHK